MNNGYGVLIFVGIIILGITAAHQYTQIVGGAVIAIGFIIMGSFGAMLNYLDNKGN